MSRHAELAWLAAQIYEPWDAFEREVHRRGWHVSEVFSHQGTDAALVIGKTWAAIVFRGTEASNFKIRDIYSNLTIPWPTVWQGAGRVHSGYRRHLNLVGHKAFDYATRVSSRLKLYVVGHSLGGAIGTLFASWYYYDNRGRKTPWKLAELVTLGAPKAVDGQAAMSIGCKITRYKVRCDWAPSWPPVPGLGHPVPATMLAPQPGYEGLLDRHDVRGYVEAVAHATP